MNDKIKENDLNENDNGLILQNLNNFKKNIEELQLINDYYRAILDNSFDILILLDGNNGQIIDINKTVTHILGYEVEEIIGKNFNVFIEDNPEIMDKDVNIYDSVVSYRQIKKKNGELKLMDMTFNMIKLNEKPLIIINLRDAEERAKADKEIKRFSEQLSELNKTKDKFFSIIAHDLKNPFSSLLGLSEILESDFHEMADEDILSLIREIRKVSKGSYQLLENLLHWSRAQTGKISYQPSELDLKFIISEVINLVDSQAKSKNIDLRVVFEEDYVVYADDDLLMTVLRNLLTNAVKYSSPFDFIEINANIFDESNLVVSVKDNGMGINKGLEKSLFSVDRGESLPGTANEKGTGLGLILCKEFIELNKGKIWFANNADKGATFFITIPLIK